MRPVKKSSAQRFACIFSEHDFNAFRQVMNYYDIYRGVIDAARGYDADVSFFDRTLSIERFVAEKHYRDYSGILGIIPWTKLSPSGPATRIGISAPFVNMLIDDRHGQGNYVGPDERQSVSLLVQHLVSEGFERIGFFCFGFERYTLDRYAGYRNALAANGMVYEGRLVFSDSPLEKYFNSSDGTFAGLPALYRQSESVFKQLFERILARKPSPDAVIFSSSYFAHWFWDHALERGARIPEDIAIVGIGDEITTYDRFETHPLTVARQNYYEIGGLATELLYGIIHHTRRRSGEKIYIKPELIVRKSSLKKNRPRSGAIAIRHGIERFIHEHYAERKLLEKAALRFDMNYNAFSRKFRSLFGKSLQKYLTGMRVEKLAFYLEHTVKPVWNILAGIGCNHHQRLYAHFRGRYGVSPEKFRKTKRPVH